MLCLHLGSSVSVAAEDIIGIFDLDNASTAKATREFLRAAEEEGMVSAVGEELPKSFALCCPKGSWPAVYLSPLSPATLQGRLNQFPFSKPNVAG